MKKIPIMIFILLSAMIISLAVVVNTALAERPYIHQLSDYIKARDMAKKGEWYGHFRPACQPSAEFQNDRCMREFVMGNMTEALRGMYYLEDKELNYIAEFYANTKMDKAFKTRIEYVEKVIYVDVEITPEVLDAAVKAKITNMLNE